jgi:FkbM family methyltransferase
MKFDSAQGGVWRAKRIFLNMLRLAVSPRMTSHYLRWLWSTKFRRCSPTVALQGGICVGGFISFSEYWQHHRGLDRYDFDVIRTAVHACEPGLTAVDVGANLGLFSLILAQVGCARVHAFEPIPQTYSRLLVNLERNPELGRKIVANQLALGARAGTFDFAVSFTSPGQNKMALSCLPGSRSDRRIACNVITLDSYFTSVPVPTALVIKIDVEGFETDVLRGAECLLRSGRVRFIYSEIIPQALTEAGSSVGEFSELLHSVGFDPMILDGHSITAVPLAEALDRAGERRNVLFRYHGNLNR